MRRALWSRILALMLIISMCVTPVAAAGPKDKTPKKPGTSQGTEVTEPTADPKK